jgi:hypothetical protein
MNLLSSVKGGEFLDEATFGCLDNLSNQLTQFGLGLGSAAVVNVDEQHLQIFTEVYRTHFIVCCNDVVNG